MLSLQIVFWRSSVNHYLWSIQTNKKKTRVLFHYYMHNLFKVKMCFTCIKPPNKRQLNTILYYTPSKWAVTPIGQTHICQDLQNTQVMDRQTPTTVWGKVQLRQFNRNNLNIRYSGTGITAAAGTRLALHLILIKGFKVNSLQLLNIIKETCIVIFRHYLAVLAYLP
jgi:hypothetical protein